MPATIKARGYEVRRWLAWRGRAGPFDAGPDDVNRFLSNRELGARARYTAISHLHDFYGWARRLGYTTTDPTETIVRPRLRPRLPRPMPDADLSMALELAGGEVLTMLMLGALAGLRVGEMDRLRWSDVDVARAELRVQGKGDKERVVPIPAALVAHLAGLEPRRTGRVLSTANAARASTRLNTWLHGIGITATSHQLRHWYATQALRLSHDIYAVQQLLGHATPASTAIYAQLDRQILVPIADGITLPPRTANPGTATPS